MQERKPTNENFDKQTERKIVKGLKLLSVDINMFRDEIYLYIYI